MNIILSFYESAMLAMQRSVFAAHRYQNQSLILTEKEANALCESLIVDYICSKAKYPCVVDRLDTLMRSKFPWWNTDPGTGLKALLVEQIQPNGQLALVSTVPEINVIAFKRNETLMTCRYMEEVIMEVEDVLLTRIKELIPTSTWVVWHSRNLGDEVLIEKGEDYRVIDWERRMESGEWKHESGLFA